MKILIGSFFEMTRIALKFDTASGFSHVVGIGGIGSGVLFKLDGDHTIGRDESRLGQLLPARDFCKLHIVEHYIATLMGSGKTADACEVLAIGVIGEDAVGRQLKQEMENAGIGTEWVRATADRPTLFSVSFLYPDGAGGNITANNSAASALDMDDIHRGEKVMAAAARRCVALCLPEVPLEIRHEFLKLATRCGNFRAASFALSEIQAANELGLLSMVDLLALNREEAAGLVGYEYSAQNQQQFLLDCASILRKMQPGIRIVISAGAEGAHAFEHGSWSSGPAPATQVISTAGAGDALLAGVLSGLASGLPLNAKPSVKGATIDGIFSSAMDIGMLLASFSVTSPDTIHFGANLAMLEEYASTLNPVS
ncbi:MAG: PfkB family carbohydrate kinase [Terracidiphilus sp.]